MNIDIIYIYIYIYIHTHTEIAIPTLSLNNIISREVEDSQFLSYILFSCFEILQALYGFCDIFKNSYEKTYAYLFSSP